MRVKICGITNLEDALSCYQNGAQALGFIFAPISPRFIKPEKAAQIINGLPPFCERIGVFVDEDIFKIVQIVKQCKLSAVQLHGKSENSEYINQLYNLLSVPIIRAVRLKNLEDCELLTELPSEKLQAVLIDGMGQSTLSQEIYLKALNLAVKPLILAGALGLHNIKEIIFNFKPQAIDLCSALEKQAGQKDPQKVEEFFRLLK
jgi:phosphoribosylanthranilate isomerase